MKIFRLFLLLASLVDAHTPAGNNTVFSGHRCVCNLADNGRTGTIYNLRGVAAEGDDHGNIPRDKGVDAVKIIKCVEVLRVGIEECFGIALISPDIFFAVQANVSLRIEDLAAVCPDAIIKICAGG